MKDNVNHPEHYNGRIECIDAMEAAFGKQELKAFCKCNAFKYIWRLGKKDDETQDAKKAVWYLNKYIECSEDNKNKSNENCATTRDFLTSDELYEMSKKVAQK